MSTETIVHVEDPADNSDQEEGGEDYVLTFCGKDITFKNDLTVVKKTAEAAALPNLCPDCRRYGFPTAEELAEEKAKRNALYLEMGLADLVTP